MASLARRTPMHGEAPPRLRSTVADAEGDKLCYSTDASSGAVTGCIAVSSAGEPLSIVTTSELDFAADVRILTSNAPTAGVAYAVVSNGGTEHVYSIDLSSGAATDHGRSSGGPRAVLGLAVGHATGVTDSVREKQGGLVIE